MNQDDYKIAKNLPASLDTDNMRELAEVIDQKMAEINQMTELVSIYPRIDELPSDLIDALAIQFHVDYYVKSLPLDKRRSLVKNSMCWHLRKGTKGVVQEMVQTVFDSGVVREWYEYGGKPYYFRVDLMDTVRITSENLTAIVKAINMVKNVRSWLDVLGFCRESAVTVYMGAIPNIGVRYEIRPADVHDASIGVLSYVGAVPAVGPHYEVFPHVVSDTAVSTAHYYGVMNTLHNRFEIDEKS